MNIALIGCGRIGFLLEDDPLRYKPCTHYGGAVSAGLSFTCACDINEERLEKFAETAGIPAGGLYADYRALLRDKKPGLAVIATWTDSHDEICVEAAKNGARVIVLEKPVSWSLKQARRTLKFCGDTGAAVIVNHERRYAARYRALKRFIEDGIVGRVMSVRGSMLTSGYSGESTLTGGGGPFLHDGTHLVDTIRYLFGDLKSARGRFTRAWSSGFEDHAVAWMDTRTGMEIFLEAGGRRDYFVFELTVSGTRGEIIIGNGYERFYLGEESRYYTGFKDLVEKKFPAYENNNCFTELYGEAAALLEGKPVTVASSGLDGYRALEAVHAVYLSSRLDGKAVSLPVRPGRINLKKIFSLP